MTTTTSRDGSGEPQQLDQDAPSGRIGNRDRIAARSYELYEARGREDGHDLEDWLAAERELRDAPHRAES
jgi:hypothetical protein